MNIRKLSLAMKLNLAILAMTQQSSGEGMVGMKNIDFKTTSDTEQPPAPYLNPHTHKRKRIRANDGEFQARLQALSVRGAKKKKR